MCTTDAPRTDVTVGEIRQHAVAESLFSVSQSVGHSHRSYSQGTVRGMGMDLDWYSHRRLDLI